MIHGHAKIKDAPTTDNYCLCGDFNEVNEISNLIDNYQKLNKKSSMDDSDIGSERIYGYFPYYNPPKSNKDKDKDKDKYPTDEYGIINLKNHGFLIYSNTIEQLEELIKKTEFYY